MREHGFEQELRLGYRDITGGTGIVRPTNSALPRALVAWAAAVFLVLGGPHSGPTARAESAAPESIAPESFAPESIALESIAPAVPPLAAAIKSRHVDISRESATQQPRGEGDQALVDGWPLYRTERGQQAFNDAMAALAATDGPAPAASAFSGCAELICKLALPAMDGDGWLEPGRIWISPTDYVLFVKSPRLPEGESYRRRSFGSMKYFILHEFQNNNFNTDTFDTISAHTRSVFVPFYMSKSGTDAKGHRFVIVVQVAPYDVVSRHASNRGSAGPGIEVAKNTRDELEPLQASAGILVASMIKKAAPHLKLIHHRNVEGMPMLNAYDRRLARLSGRPAAPAVELPFVPAVPERIATATFQLSDLVARPAPSAPLTIAERAFVPPKSEIAVPRLLGPIRLAVRPRRLAEPVLVGPIKLAVRPVAAPAGAAAR